MDAVLDVNAFRTLHLYNSEVDAVFKANKTLLIGIFALYRTKARTKAGGVLRSSTQSTLNLPLIIRESA
jgi:hypothetical protein